MIPHPTGQITVVYVGSFFVQIAYLIDLYPLHNSSVFEMSYFSTLFI
jgi:hypothetical protein